MCLPMIQLRLVVWRATPGERWLAALLGNPVVRPVTRLVYDRFADLLAGGR